MTTTTNNSRSEEKYFIICTTDPYHAPKRQKGWKKIVNRFDAWGSVYDEYYTLDEALKDLEVIMMGILNEGVDLRSNPRHIPEQDGCDFLESKNGTCTFSHDVWNYELCTADEVAKMFDYEEQEEEEI